MDNPFRFRIAPSASSVVVLWRSLKPLVSKWREWMSVSVNLTYSFYGLVKAGMQPAPAWMYDRRK